MLLGAASIGSAYGLELLTGGWEHMLDTHADRTA